MALYADPSTGALLVNADGSIFDTDDETLAACCCDDYYELNLNAILERQKAAGVDTEDLIDTGGTYTLAQLCAEANKFSGSSANGVQWMALAGWSDKTATPGYVTDSDYFGIVGSGATVEVANAAALHIEVVKFRDSWRALSGELSLSPTVAVAYDGSYSGQNWVDLGDGEWIDQEEWSVTKAGAEADWGVDSSPSSFGVTSRLQHVGQYWTPTASLDACVPDDAGTDKPDTRVGRTLKLYIKGKPPIVPGASFDAFGCGCGNGSYGLAASKACSAGAANSLPGPRWSGYPGPPGWPYNTPDRIVGYPWPGAPDDMYAARGWLLDACVLIIEWDFTY